MENYKLLNKILPFLDEYEKKNKNTDLKEFSVYLKNQVWDYEKDKEISIDKTVYKNYKSFPEVEFISLITTLYRFSKYYLKQIFKPRKFKTIDEFGFLAKIFQQGHIQKNKLFDSHLMEISSGSEIIKRLINNGLVLEYPDKYDKRAKNVELTDLGKVEIIAAFEDMFKVAKLLKGNLNKNEFMSTLEVFNKLNYFHWHLHNEEKKTSIEELFEKYIDKKPEI